jgi:cytochrome P450
VPEVIEGTEVSALLRELTTSVGREDPYPRYHRLRSISPVVRADDRALVVTRHADCTTLARDGNFVKLPADALAFIGFPDWADHPSMRQLFTSMLAVNPPDHTRLRRVVSGAFTARRVQALGPAIETMVSDLLDTMDGEVDLAQSFAFQLPVNVIGELLGIPAADRAQFRGLVRDWARILEVLTPEAVALADPAAATVRDYLADQADQRRRHPGTDLLSALVAAEGTGNQLTEEEVITTAGLLFAAGFETTANLLVNSVVALLDHPEQLALLREQPGLAPSAVEELLRFDSPVQLISRITAEPMTLGGIDIAPGERVIAYLGAGNRDPERFDEPDRLDLGRTNNAPLSFGGGIHYCLGAPLARLETQLALPALFQRFPRLALTGTPERRDGLTIRGYTRLPVSLN